MHLWELVQHSRFNAMLSRVFKCGPESARDSEYRGYMSSKSIPTYAMCRSDGHASLKRVAVAAHVATVILEGSVELRKEFIEFVKTRYPQGDDMVCNECYTIKNHFSANSGHALSYEAHALA